MNLRRNLARCLMRLATHRPPPDRAEWALAMQREFDMLDSGELGWALGCVTTAAGWKLREQWLYLALLCLVPFIIEALNSLPFKLVWWEVISPSSLRNLLRSYGVVLAMLTPLPLAIILGAYRPHSIATTIALGLLFQHVGRTLITINLLGGSFLSWWGPQATLYMAPPLVGLCASIGVWYVGASAGAWWSKRRWTREPLPA